LDKEYEKKRKWIAAYHFPVNAFEEWVVNDVEKSSFSVAA